MAGKSSKSEAELAETVAAAQQGNGPLTGGEAVGVDKIRDLLFGNQMQDYDRRFSKLEARTHRSAALILRSAGMR